jgi:hypothetical protein
MNKKRNKRPKVKPEAWFVRIRGSYLPASPAGWWLYVPFVTYLVFSAVVAINGTSSNTLAVLYIVPNWVAAAAVMTYVAALKS